MVALRRELRGSNRTLSNEAVNNTYNSNTVKAVDYFIDRIQNYSGLSPENIVFVVNCNRHQLYLNLPNPETPKRNALMDYFINQSKLKGIHIVDTCPIFAEYIRKTQTRIDYSPFDNHWNAKGHELAAKAVESVLRRQN